MNLRTLKVALARFGILEGRILAVERPDEELIVNNENVFHFGLAPDLMV